LAPDETELRYHAHAMGFPGGSEDTSAAQARRYFELLRERSPAERARILAGLNAAVRRLAESSVRAAFPAASAREVEARVAARIYGDAVATRLFPDVSLP
jgi:hypothetical protein